MDRNGIVYNIQRFTVHDGPGIRTEIFMKGCTLRCRWCSNPESLLRKCQVGVYPSKCLGTKLCGACVRACPRSDQSPFFIEAGKVIGIDREKCSDCMKCQEQCPSDALKRWGEEMTVEAVMKIIRADRAYYDKSGGGVTISGGESLLQWEFSRDILTACKQEGIHTCVETALAIPGKILDKIIPYCDLFITDIKHMDDQIHKEYTGTGNRQILKNIKRITESGRPVVLRIPVIPNVNDSIAQIRQVGQFIVAELNHQICQVQMLRFRRLGEEKYKSLGLPYQMADVNPGREEYETHIKMLAGELRKFGIPVFAGTTNKIDLSKF